MYNFFKHNKKKKLFPLLMTLVFLFSLLGCSQNTEAQSIGIIGGLDRSTEVFVKENTSPDQEPAQKALSNLDNEKKNSLGMLKVHFIDVGQADSILIQQIINNTTYNMLIDAGNNDDSELVLNYLRNQGVERLEYVIGTHPHGDHIGGLDVAINNFSIGKVVMPKITHTIKTFEDVVAAIQNKNLKITTPKTGDTYKLGNAEWTVLAPNSAEYEDLNDYSIVLRLAFGNNSFMLTGDAEAVSESEILAQNQDIQSDVLKAGHHGSNSSTTDSFLQAVNPRFVVVSVEKDNEYGHPHKEVLNKLIQTDMEVLRTDSNGTIIFTSDGSNLTYKTTKKSATQEDVKQKPKAPINEQSIENNDNSVNITSLDKKSELITVANSSNNDIDLTEWRIVSVTGNQQYTFPNGFILKANSSVIVASGDSAGDLKWGKANIWNNSKSDPAELYDNHGNLISEFEN